MFAEEDVHVQVAFQPQPEGSGGSRKVLTRFPFPCLRSEREELCDVKNYKIKAQNDKKKKDILSSLFKEYA